MATNLKIDDELINDAVRLSGASTKKQAVTMALEEFVRKHRQHRLLEAAGTIDFDPEYDYKAARKIP